MNYILRFLTIYIVVVVAIFSFYYTITKHSREESKLIVKEIKGLNYLKELYQLVNDLMEYKYLIHSKYQNSNKIALENVITKEIDAVLTLRENHFGLHADKLQKLLSEIKTFHYSQKSFRLLLEQLINEIYLLGDRSGLLFQSDRKIFFLNSMLTHYLPEYIISLSITRNIVSYYIKNSFLTEQQKELYTEQRNLLVLSSRELDTIITIIENYKDVKPLKMLKPRILQKIAKLPNNFDNPQKYLNQLTEILSLSYRLNSKSVKIVEASYKSRKKLLQKEFFYNTSLLIVILVSISGLFIYFRILYASDRKKEKDIKSMAQKLNKLVIYAKTNVDGEIIDVSEALIRKSGFNKEELLGKKHKLFQLENFNKDENWSGELEEFTKENIPYWLQVTLISEYDEENYLRGYVVYGVDITYQKEIEEQKKKTQEALSFRSKFLSNMSHEIRTPLNGIMGFIDIVLKTNLDVNQKGILLNIKTTSDLLLGIINDILDISKIESGKMTIEYHDFNLKELVENISNIMTPKANEKSISLELEFKNITHAHYIGDDLRISQVITNLLSNAIKFTQKGYVKLIVEKGDKNDIKFCVEDTGIGLKKESLNALFEEFTQADMSTSRKYGGTGLGLSICKNLVHLMGGKLEVESEFTKGSKFNFSLKLEESFVEFEKESEVLEFTELEKEINSLKDIKILVAEDNKMNQMVLSMLLEDSKFSLVFANDGQIAVDEYKKQYYDLILMDLQMPNMDGYEATSMIRKVDQKIPIIALSANVLQEDIDRAIKCGMNSHLAKPIEIKKLYTYLLKYLKV